MGSGASIPRDQHVVVVGGGYAGTQTGMELMKRRIPFTLISPRDCMHHNIAALRATVEPGFSNKTLIPLAVTFGEHFKKGKVVDIRTGNKKVVLESGEEVGYDILVLATGTSGPFPAKFDMSIDREAAIPMYDAMVQKVQNAQKVLVIGGGATGVELATEVACKYPDKEVTLLHASENLINNEFADKFQKKLKGIMRKQKINLILGERVSLDDVPDDGPVSITTNKGTSLQADLVFKTVGVPVQTGAYRNALGGHMEGNGQLKVNEYLEVEGQQDIYAIGDCCNSENIKLAFQGVMQGTRVVENICAKAGGKKGKVWKDTGPVIAVVSLGPNTGISQTRGGSLVPSFIVKKFKSQHVAVPDFWKALKQPVPK